MSETEQKLSNRLHDDGTSPEWQRWLDKHRPHLNRYWDSRRSANRAFHYALELGRNQGREEHNDQ